MLGVPTRTRPSGLQFCPQHSPVSGTGRDSRKGCSGLLVLRRARPVADECAACAKRLSDFLSPSPPAEKTTARQHQARKASTDDRPRHGSYGVYQDRPGKVSVGSARDDVKYLSDVERLSRRNACQGQKISPELAIGEESFVDQCTNWIDVV